MELRDLHFDAKKTLGENILLIGVRKVYTYKDDKPTDEIKGFKYTVLLKDKNYERVDIMVQGQEQMIECSENEQMLVEFGGLKVKVYVNRGRIYIYLYAEYIRPKITK